ncbi:MAG: hypothetical protein AUH21_02295 [Nitrospirae bacterium 13_2_20CM_62_7]|nr:MAG: hypothetical protein AUH21_02295 [Nitrospirae bacterium 13_2_20CM_62_7]
MPFSIPQLNLGGRLARGSAITDAVLESDVLSPRSPHASTGPDGLGPYRLVLLQALVSIVLSYQLLFSPAPLLPRELQDLIILGLLMMVAGLMALPARLLEHGLFVGGLLVVDTVLTSAIIYLSGEAGSDLYLTYFMIILLSAAARTLKQKIGFVILLCAIYGVALFLTEGTTGLILEGQLIRIPSEEKTELMDYIARSKEVERQLRQADRLAALGRLLDGVAHELNNPLFVISGYAQLAIEKIDRGHSEGLTADLTAVLEATPRATDVIKRFMGLARSAPGRYEPCEVTSVVQRTLELMANDFKIHDIEVRTAFQPDLPSLLADPQELTQVFLNLLTNAKQAMAGNGRGTLTVTTALVPTRHGPGWRFASPTMVPEFPRRISRGSLTPFSRPPRWAWERGWA